MKNIIKLVLILNGFLSFAQEEKYTTVDSLYREDQFYFGITYNTLQNKPAGLSQNSFSTGLNIGFLRDMPLNKERTVAIAAGLGVSYKLYQHNLLISENQNIYNYSVIDNSINFSNNNFSLFLLEAPIEFRWRKSNALSHRFFRIYSGFKASYVVSNRYIHTSSLGDYKIKNIKDFNSLQYGVYFAIGYNTWNFYSYYGLDSIFKNSTQINSEKLDLKTLNFGLQFYIL